MSKIERPSPSDRPNSITQNLKHRETFWTSNQISRKHLSFSAGFLSLAVFVLYLMGRTWWCSCGTWTIWSGETKSMHNSQHLFDAYTLTHVLHGLALYLFLWLLMRHWTGQAFRGITALGLESCWEILENTSMVIEKYREATISLDYYGDSIVNSLGDITACLIGYVLAAFLPVFGSIAIFLGIEGFLIWWIRDSLLLNILMLIWPSEAVKDWQSR